MELVNSNYVRIEKFDVFSLMNKYVEKQEYEKLDFVQKIFNKMCEYEKDNKVYIKDVYVSINSDIFVDEYDFMMLSIERSSIINAYYYSCLNGDEIKDLKFYSIKKDVKACELGEHLDYVLNNTINPDEYFDGEKERYIYNLEKDCIEKGYIYSNTNEKKFVK